jgi:hypothetical protein
VRHLVQLCLEFGRQTIHLRCGEAIGEQLRTLAPTIGTVIARLDSTQATASVAMGIPATCAALRKFSIAANE